MNHSSQLREIAVELSRLLATSPTDKELLPAWYQASRAFVEKLNTELGDVNLPEEVWHFLSDADIRAKDPEFRAVQIQAITEVIRELERGVMPQRQGATVAIDGRWLLFLIVLAAIAAIFSWVAL